MTRTGARARTGGGYLRSVALDLGEDANPEEYPFDLPAVAALAVAPLELDPAVTFLVGDNGTGKSTLVEASAVALGFNAEGGSKSFRFITRSTESDLWRHLRLTRTPAKPRNGFFLRAESFYNVATEIENLAGDGPGLFGAYGGRSLHERSHGESFLAVAMHRFGPNGLYLLDEPEAALSVRGQLALLAHMRDLIGLGCQFLVATHSPILIAFPGASIVQIDETGMHQVSYDDAEPVQLTRSFLENPQRFLRHLLDDVDDQRR